MNSFHALIQQLALQVDRKILEAEEADHLRLDLSAHEKAGTFALAWKQENVQSRLKRFVLAALLIYFTLFTLTNAQAYAKIALASLEGSIQKYEDQVPLQTGLSMDSDPWTGSKIAEQVEPEKPLSMLSYAPDPLSGLALSIGTPTAYDNRIVIPSLNINAPVIEPTLGLSALEAKDWKSLEDQIHGALLKGVVHYPGTAVPGQKGNAFLTGHSSNVFWEQSLYNTVFALLPKIEIGDDIFITYEQTEFHYKVTSKKEVSPNDLSAFQQTEGETLTLVTCTPVGTTLKRLVVTAELVKE